MPKLHARLKHVTQADPVSLQLQDVVEPAPKKEEAQDREERLRRQRRIETIANQYIKLGRVPLILSAGLRGPFDNGWKNPWAKTPSRTSHEAVASGGIEKSKSHRSKRAKTAISGGKQTRTVGARPASSVPSPEASRGPDAAHDSVLPPDDADDDWHVSLRGTAPQDDTGATEFFSVDPDPSITFDGPESNPFWLKRPLPVSTALGDYAHGKNEPSPTRARLGDRPVDQRGRLLLVTPRQPISVVSSEPVRNLEQEPDWLSTTPTSTGMKSPPRTARSVQQPSSLSASGKRKRTYSKYERTQVFENRSTASSPKTPALPKTIETGRLDASRIQVTERQGMPPPEPPCRLIGVSPVNAASPSVTTTHGPGPISSEDTIPDIEQAKAAQISSSISDASKRRPQQDAHASAQHSSPAAPSAHPLRGEKKAVKNATPTVRHDRVTSPTLGASTGFVYRKIGEPKRPKSLAETKPKPLTFSSPNKIDQHITETAEQAGETIDATRKQEAIPASEPCNKRTDVYDVPGSPQGQRQNYTSKRTSDFSTQAALLMAQIDFQDGTMPEAEEADTRPWLHAVDSTPHDDPIVPSPAFTPFHRFNATLGEDSPLQSTMKDIPISTQDLFAAVSPFGYSTIKKSSRHTASSMRISVFANNEQDTPSHNDRDRRHKSPTPSQRIPLKAKNTAVSFLGSQSEKVSQEAATSQPSKAGMVQGVELPRLDFDTSLDELRRNDDLNFTDRFLVNFNEWT